MIIRNRAELNSHGNAEARDKVLSILEAGLEAPDPYENTKKVVRLEGNRLIVGLPEFSEPLGQEPMEFDLSKINNIYVVGGGKSVQRQAKALEDILGDRITEGHIIIKKGDEVQLETIPVTLGGHPVPDEDCVRGAKKILAIEKKAREGDIVFWCMSGGGSSLLSLPAPGITLDELRQVYRILYMECGASMPEANAVRNLITILRMKHQKYVKGATLFQLRSTEMPPKDDVHKFAPITSMREKVDFYERAIGVLERYKCWDRVPASVRAFLKKADPQYLFPSEAEKHQRPYMLIRVMGPEYMIDAALKKAKEMGVNASVIASSLNDIEAQPVAEAFAHIAREAENYQRPLKPPCVFLCGGELVVPIGGATGSGGRNQEFVMSAAPLIAGSKNIIIASADSDGTDGPTDIAGGIVDGNTMQRLSAAGIDFNGEMANHNSSYPLKELHDAIYTSYVGANCRDLRLIYVGGTDD